MEYEKEFVFLDKTLHERETFDCGEPELNSFLQTKASKHMAAGISTTRVLPAVKQSNQEKADIAAFYSVAPSSVARDTIPEKLAKKLPHYPVPVYLIAQLAVHKDCKCTGLGGITLVTALKFLLTIDEKIKGYAVIVDCLNDNARQFYTKYGFQELITNNGRVRMFMPMGTVKQL